MLCQVSVSEPTCVSRLRIPAGQAPCLLAHISPSGDMVIWANMANISKKMNSAGWQIYTSAPALNSCFQVCFHVCAAAAVAAAADATAAATAAAVQTSTQLKSQTISHTRTPVSIVSMYQCINVSMCWIKAQASTWTVTWRSARPNGS
jgi:hypothetical protein